MKKVKYEILTGSTSGTTYQLPVFLEASVDEMGIMVGFDGEIEQVEQFCNFTYVDGDPSPVMPDITPTRTPSKTPSASVPAPFITPSISLSATIGTSATPSPSIYRTPSITPTKSVSSTPIPSQTTTQTPTPTPTITQTPSITPSTSMIIYYGCADYGLELTGDTGGSFLSSGNLISHSGATIGDYVIEWRQNSISGDIIFVSGIGTDPEIQAQHPFIDEVVLAGTLYPIIRYVYINGYRYNTYSSAGARFSPDLITCLSSVVINPITCSTTLGADTLYPFYLTYNNVTDYGQNKSREFQFILSSGTTYFAWEFQGYTVAEQLKIYYCNSGDTVGTLVDNFINGINGVVINYYPTNYPTNPKITNPSFGGTAPLAYITRLSGFTWSEGNYLRIQIIGSVYQPTVTNTNWYIKCKCLTTVDIDCTSFIADSGMYKIVSGTTQMLYSGDPTCTYNIVYETEDSPFTSLPARTTGGLPNLYKYVGGFSWWYGPTGGNPAGNRYDNPVKLPLRWSTQASSYSIYGSPGYTTCVNLDSGQTITVTKTTTGMTFTFTDIDDYNVFVSDIATFKASSYYNTWTGLTDTDSRYYSTMRIMTTVATSCGDAKTDYYWYFFWGCPIAYDAGLKTITITFVIPTNNIVSGTCDSTYSYVNTTISAQYNQTKNYVIPGGSLTTHVRYQGTVYCWWVYYTIFSEAQKEIGYGIGIEDSLLNDICNLSTFGFCKGVTGSTSTLWVLPKYWDRITLTDTSDHSTRLANWRLERRTFLRTDNCADQAWEIVDESP
jgi:hypothetical protein